MSIVGSASRRLSCWVRQPVSIASNIAGSGCNSVAPSTSTRRAAPATSSCLIEGLRSSPRARTGCSIVASTATEVVDPHVSSTNRAGPKSSLCDARNLQSPGSGTFAPNVECCIGCNSARFEAGPEGVPKLVRHDPQRLSAGPGEPSDAHGVLQSLPDTVGAGTAAAFGEHEVTEPTV